MDSFNNFDAFVVILSYLEIILLLAEVQSAFLNSLRALRALRMLKLARYNKGMRTILNKTQRSLRALTSFSAVLLLFLFVWALMGMDLFAY